MEKVRWLKILGNNIRMRREDLGLIQDETAHLAGLSRSYYSDVERGSRNVSAINLMRISIALKIDPGKMFPSLEELGKN